VSIPSVPAARSRNTGAMNNLRRVVFISGFFQAIARGDCMALGLFPYR
jgi:hypothetical protein